MRGGGKKQEAEALPTLQVILRKFYLKVRAHKDFAWLWSVNPFSVMIL